MSGPKVVDYQAVERQRAETARRQWQALRGRADALRQRCIEARHPDCAVELREPAGTSSDVLELHCGQAAAQLVAAEEELSRRRFADRTREVADGLRDVLADLEGREKHGAEVTGRRDTAAAPPATSRRTAAAPPDYADRVTRQLASLHAPQAELAKAAQSVLRERDPARARILYNDLADRVSGANKKTAIRNEQLAEIAELRAQLDGLTDPAPLRSLLDQATDDISRGADAGVALRQARNAITAQLDAAAAAADREFVRAAVAESLRDLGYDVADVELETPESLVFRQNRTHGVRADIADGRLDIRAVRLGASADRSADRDAEDEFCNRLPHLLDSLRSKGITTGIRKSTLPGLLTPETVAVRDRRAAATAHDHAKPQARKRTAR